MGERVRVAQWLPLKEGDDEAVLDGLCEVHAVELRLPEPEPVPVPLPETEREMLPEVVRERAGERVAETEKDCSVEGVCEALVLTEREALLQPVALRVPELQAEAVEQPLVLALAEGLSEAEEVGLCVCEVVPLTLLDAQSVADTEAEGLPVFETVLETETEAHAETVMEELPQPVTLLLTVLQALRLAVEDGVVLPEKDGALAAAEALVQTVGDCVLLVELEGESDSEIVSECELQLEVVGECEVLRVADGESVKLDETLGEVLPLPRTSPPPAPLEALGEAEIEWDVLPLEDREGVLVTLCEGEREAHLVTLGECEWVTLNVPHAEAEKVVEWVGLPEAVTQPDVVALCVDVCETQGLLL